MNEHTLAKFLKDHNIPLGLWGTGEAKSIGHLANELQTGEAQIKLDGGKLIRSAEGSALQVYFKDTRRTLRLQEDRQVFKDGRVKRRKLETSVGEKMRPGETAIEAAKRTLREELKITDDLTLLPLPPIIKGPMPSQSFPGLMSHYLIHVFEVYLPEHLFRPEGYIEEQPDKTSYFVWTDVMR